MTIENKMTLQIKQLDGLQIIFKQVDEHDAIEIGYIGSCGDVGLKRCVQCLANNHPLAIRTGVCCHCGFDLNAELL